MTGWRIAIGLGAGAAAAPALSCTLCHGGTGDAVRAALLTPGAWETAAGLLSPFPVLAVAVLVARRAAR